MPLFSIIVPCYNDGDFAIEAINSCMQQDAELLEIIFVDDGSTDDSLTMVGEIYRGISNVHIYSKPNGGLSSARNFGLNKCVGEYILFLDSDDLLHKNFLLFAKKEIEKISDKKKVCIFPFAYFNLGDSCERSNWVLKFRPPILGNIKWLNLLMLATTNCFPVSSVLIPRDVAVSNGGFDEKLPCYEDWDFWLRITKNGVGFSYLADKVTPCTFIRIRGGMSSDVERMKMTRRNVFRKNFANSNYMIFSVKYFGEIFRKLLVVLWKFLSFFIATPNYTRRIY